MWIEFYGVWLRDLETETVRFFLGPQNFGLCTIAILASKGKSKVINIILSENIGLHFIAGLVTRLFEDAFL